MNPMTSNLAPLSEKYIEAVNWNALQDKNIEDFYDINRRQVWFEHDVPLTTDINSWVKLTEEEKTAYKKVLAGLTLLDTLQGTEGVPRLKEAMKDLTVKATLGWIATMEEIHAKSYSSIFSTVCTTQETQEAFDWVHRNPHAQKKAQIIKSHYEAIREEQDETKKQERLFIAMSASIYLESFLFYSGFFLPFYMAGNQKMRSSAEIIKLILRDECLVAGTELLTPTGWQPVESIKRGDKVAQHFDGELTFGEVKFTSTTEVPYTYVVKDTTGKVHQQVSPNHRIIFYTNGEHYEMRAYDFEGIEDAQLFYVENTEFNVEAENLGMEVQMTKGYATLEKIEEVTKVYGVEVPTQELLIRSEGKVSVTGNSVHSQTIGYLAMNLYDTFDSETQTRLFAEIKDLMMELYEVEKLYTAEIYDPLGITEDVMKFVEYNADKALQALGFDAHFNVDHTEINAYVFTALGLESTTTGERSTGANSIVLNDDPMTTKGSSYVKATNVKEIQKGMFDFD